jgi:hypothetical protein
VGSRPTDLSARSGAGGVRTIALALVTLSALAVSFPGASAAPPAHPPVPIGVGAASNSSAVANFSAAINRLVDLVGVAGSGLLALVWARVALSWFSHDVSKKVQAKDRARDALVGTLLFVAALTGLVWGLAHWVLTGS